MCVYVCMYIDIVYLSFIYLSKTFISGVYNIFVNLSI